MKLVHNPEALRNSIAINKDNQAICLNALRVVVPRSFFENNLGTMTDKVNVYGLFPVIQEDNQFAMVNITARVSLTPSATKVVVYGGEEYYEFSFEKNSVFMPNVAVVQDGKIIYEVFRNFFFIARNPWYMDYEIHGSIFDSAPKFAGFGSLKSPELNEFLTAHIARKAGSSDNLPLRNSIRKYEDGAIGNVTFVAMGSVIQSVRSPLTKITGPYALDGLISAIVSPSENVGNVEKIIRAR